MKRKLKLQILQVSNLLLLMLISTCTICYAQFNAGVQGSVQDSGGAVIVDATVTLVNVQTRVPQEAKTNGSGVYRFVNIPPGDYTVKFVKPGFESQVIPFNVGTGELRNVPAVLAVGSESVTISVDTQAPLVDTSDSRSQLTLNSTELEALPNTNLSPLTALDLTPGVTGGASGSNYSPQNYVSISASGRGENGNSIVLDGISVTDSTRQGVLNVTPNLDSLQEIAVQPNTYSVQSMSSSIQIQMTTKSGGDKYHGSASAYYQYQGLNARGEYGPPPSVPLDKYHTDNLSFTFGGPVPRVKQLFFFAAYNPFLAINPSSSSTVLITSPTFINTYMAKGSQTSPEVAQILQSYNQPSSRFVLLNQGNPANYQTAAQAFNSGNCPSSGSLGPNDLNVPCSTVVNQYGLFNGTGYTNAKQYSIRIDKDFTNDRIYGSFLRSTLHSLTPGILLSSDNYSDNYEYAIQGSYTHTFTPHLLNEVTVGITRAEGIFNEGNYYYNPTIGISGFGNSYGKGTFQDGIYIILNQRYRDLLTYIHGNHSITVGAEASHTTDPAYFAPCFGIPDYYFNNPYDAANNLPDSESGLSYNFATGASEPYQYAFATTIFAGFAEDSWKVSKRLTVTYGIRYDNFGNPYPITAHGAVTTQTLLTTLRLPGNSSFQQQIANAALVSSNHTFAHDMNWNFNPRVGFAYDLLGNGRTVLRGGFGVYHDWFNLGNATNQSSTNLPNNYSPNFVRGVTAVQPLFSVGSGNTYPFGYTYPTIAAQSLDSKGGIPGSYTGIGGVDRNLSAPGTLNWSLGLEHQLIAHLAGALEYRGSHSYNQIWGGQSQGLDKTGFDVNVYNGDTISHPVFNSNGTWRQAQQTRLNTSFGSILYAFNGARANYEGFTASIHGRVGNRGFLNVSYTHGSASDNWQPYYAAYQPDGSWNGNNQYAPSAFDTRNRLSAAASYKLPELRHGWKAAQILSSGYEISTAIRLQTGTPFSVVNSNGLNVIDTVNGVQLTSSNYASELAAGHITYITAANINSANVQAAIAAGSLSSTGISGDYLGNGQNTGLPNVSSYAQNRSRSIYKYKCAVSQTGCAGSIAASQFTAPTFSASGAQGNENLNQFRNPGSQDVDIALQKTTVIWKDVQIRFRADFFNAFNRVNWGSLDGNLADYNTTFGTTQSVGAARVGQLSAKLTF